MAATGGVVVWEWQNEFGSWRSYDPRVSTFIESNKNSPHPLPLGSADPILYQYALDLQIMCQVRQGTGTQRKVRRSVYPPTSILAKGITWQWEGDVAGRWNDYHPEVAEHLEACFSANVTTIDMSKSKFFQPYHVDLKKMVQTRIETGRIRKIQRVFMNGMYPLDSPSVSVSAGKRTASSLMSTAAKRPRHTVSSLLSSMVSNSASASTSSQAPSNTVHTAPVSLLGGSLAATPGPVTRQRYNQAMSMTASQGQGPSSFHPVPSAQLSSQTTNTLVPPSYNALTSGFHFHGTGQLNGMFQSMGSSSGGGSLGGLLLSGAYTSGLTNGGYGISQQGHLVPQSLLSGSKSSRVRPSQHQNSSSSQSPRGLPQHAVIPNFTEKPHRRSHNTTPAHGADSILDNFSKVLEEPPENEDCCICYDKLLEASGHGSGSQEDHIAIQLEKCSHMFHKLCLKAMYNSGSKDGSLQCPSCKTIYGEKQGNCPRGEMEYRLIDSELEGHEGCKTIQILYNIHSGIQGPEHPQPGARYSTRGFPRIGYLPDCDKGRKVLQLLIVAWKRRLTFTVGSSTTTGELNTVTWNEIHHKTELRGNYSGHGYPDPNFLDNVLLELATHGITDKDLPSP